MNSKERIDAVLHHQPVDRTPFCLVDGGAWITKQEGVSYRQFYDREDAGASDVVRYLNQIHSDMISSVSGVFTACMNAFGCPMSMEKIGSSAELGAAFDDPETDIPKLDKSTIRETLLNNYFVQRMLLQTREIKKLIGDEKYLFGDVAGPFTMASVLVGTQDFMILLLEDPELCEDLLDFTVCVSAEMFHLLHENGCDIAFPAEPVASGSMISKNMLEEWVIPNLARLKEMLPEYKYFFTHVCGDSGSRVAYLRDIGVNAFSCDYMVDLDQALEDAEGRLVIMGNINPAGVLLTGTPEDVYKEACERIRTADGRGLILSSGCDLGAASPMENVLMLSKACEDMSR